MSDAKEIAKVILDAIESMKLVENRLQAVFYYGPDRPNGLPPFTFRYLRGADAAVWIAFAADAKTPKMAEHEKVAYNNTQTDPQKHIAYVADVEIEFYEEIVDGSGALVGFSFFCMGGQ